MKNSIIECPISQHARKNPERKAIITHGQEITYSQLNFLIENKINFLVENNVTNNSTVALFGYNNINTITTLFAIWRLRAIAFPINFKFPVEQIKDIFQSLSIDYFLISETDNIEKNRFSANIIYNVENCHSDDYIKITNKNINLENNATIILTSGTTSTGKAVLHSFGNHYYSALASNENIILENGDSWLLSLPLYHVAGIAILFRCFLAGASVSLPMDLSIIKAINHLKCTHLSLVPTQLKNLIDNFPAIAQHNLKAILLGGAPFPKYLINKAYELHLPIYKSYGLTETSSQITATVKNDNLNNLYSSGKVLKSNQIKIKDNAEEILVKGKTLFKGYLLNQKLKPAINESGWFRTGDTGYLDNNNYLHVIGRIDNMFISGGENIVPEEIEEVLLQFPEIVQAVVVPVANDEYGHRPVAFIKSNGEINREHLINELHSQLPKFKVPHIFYEWPFTGNKDDIKPKRRAFIEALNNKGIREIKL
ncbi:MAG: o-succinylbenzoate--CoA ligase [Calditrichia bacterium]|nr:o-succinylbenzoate--CoA ligase [Calditrichia bacterium]